MALAEKAFEIGQTVYVASYRGQSYRVLGSADVVVESAAVLWSGAGSTGINRKIRALGFSSDHPATEQLRDSRKAALFLLREKTEAAITQREQDIELLREQLRACEKEIEAA